LRVDCLRKEIVGDDDPLSTMVECESRCFVRVWHNTRDCSRTGRPILLVTYRLALEAFAGTDTDSYDLVFYNEHARQRIRSVSMSCDRLKLSLRREPFLGRMPVGRSQTNAKQLVRVDLNRQFQGVTVVTCTVAYSLDPYEPFRSLKLVWAGHSRAFLQSAYLGGGGGGNDEEEDEEEEEEEEEEEKRKRGAVGVVVSVTDVFFQFQPHSLHQYCCVWRR